MSKIERTYFEEVDENKLQHNHAKVLSFWLNKDRFILFRDRISVDHYLAIDVKGQQFYLFGKCRESNSDGYIEHRDESAYYITTEEARAIVKYIDDISTQPKTKDKER